MAQKKLGVSAGINLSSPFTSRNENTLVEAKNYIQDASGVMKSRRGYTRSSAHVAGPIYKAASYTETTDSLGNPGAIVVNNGGTTSPTELRFFDADGATLTSISGGFLNPDLGYRMQTMVARGNLYATETNGVYAMPATLATAAAGLRLAGQTMGTPLILRYIYMDNAPPVGPAWLAVGRAAAYRVVYGRDDTTGQILGAPSGRCVFVNSTVLGQPVLYVNLVNACNTGNLPLTAGVDWFDIYRSKTTDYATEGEPGDNMKLILRYYPSAGEIAGGFVQIRDSIDDTVWDRPTPYLYTNTDNGDVGLIGPNGAPQRGISLGNETPPRAKAMTIWNNRGWYADNRTRPTYAFNFIALPTPGDTLVINGVPISAVAAPGAPNEFEVINTGVLSFDLMQTALNFCAAVNLTPGSIYAQYSGTTTEGPGSVTLYRRDFGADFTVSTTNPAWSNPPIPDVPISGPAEFPGRLFFSKDGEPEAVPVVNFFQVGSITSRIHQLAARRNYLYCFSDAGLYRISGNDENDFAVELVEPRCHLVARETVCTGSDGLIYAICREGIAQIDDSGITWIQAGIEPVWRFNLDTIGEDNANKHWFAVSSPRWQTVTFLFSARGQGQPTGGFVWNIPTGTWTRLEFPDYEGLSLQARACGTIQPTTGKQLFCNGLSSTTDGRVMFENLASGSQYHVDMTPGGVTGGIGHVISWWPFMEQPNVKSTWREVHASFWAQLSDLIDEVPVCSVTCDTGNSVATVLGTTPSVASPGDSGGVLIPQSLLSRALVPSEVARSRSLTVSLSDLGTAESSMPVECITIIYEPYTTKEVA